MPEIDVNGVTIHYVVDGDERAEPLLVLHGGLGVDHTLYRRTLSPLGRSFRLVFFDQRANGRSGGDAAAITMEQLADDAVALADALGFDGPIAVSGHSYGGFVAQELALRHPARVSRLLLFDTTPGQLGAGEDPADHAGPPPPAELAQMLAAFPEDDEQFAAGLTRMLPYYLPGADMDEVAPLFADTVHRLAPMVRGFEVLAGWSAVDRLPAITVPTLLLVGAEDVFTSPPQSHRIAERTTNAEVVVVDDAGHFPWIQRPDVVFAAVEDWLARTRVGDGT